MGATDDLKAYLGPDLGQGKATERADRTNWQPVCACGHLRLKHPPSIGGSYPLPEPEERTAGGKPIRVIEVMDRCGGAMPPRRDLFERFTDSQVLAEDGTMVITRIHNVTCACDRFREVAEVDRPSRFFNQPIPADRKDRNRHPLPTGMRTYRKRLGKLKRAQVSELGEVWADEEFDKRFRWTAGRRCDISRCTATEDVWPVFTDDGRTALRCSKHR